MPNVAMLHEKDPRELILEQLGDLSDYEMNDEMLLAIYRRPELTKGGIALPESTRKEDLYQGKAHLIVKIGPNCDYTDSLPVKLHDWVVVRPSDGWAVQVHKVDCRHVHPKFIRARISHPEVIW